MEQIHLECACSDYRHTLEAATYDDGFGCELWVGFPRKTKLWDRIKFIFPLKDQDVSESVYLDTENTKALRKFLDEAIK